MAADHGRRMGEHPDPEVLLAYHERALPESEADRVQEHLVECLECAQAVLDFAAFPDLEPPSEEHRVTPAELQRRWRDLQAAIAERRRPWWQRHEVLLPLAATFFAAAVGLAIWGAGLRGRVAELEGPRGDVPILAELRPLDEVSRGAEEVVAIPSPAVPKIGLLLTLPPVGVQDAYRVDVHGPSGELLAREIEVYPDRHQAVLVQLPTDSLVSGLLRLTVVGQGRRGREPLAEYGVVLAR